MYRKDEITLREGHAAINVKVYRRLDSGNATEQEAERAWDFTVEQFWDDAEQLAHKRGYSGVFAEGRSGGWCVPYRQYRNGKLYQGRWEGQGPTMGYPSYPDVEHNSAERERFRAFQRDIKRLLAEVQAEYTANIEQAREVA